MHSKNKITSQSMPGNTRTQRGKRKEISFCTICIAAFVTQESWHRNTRECRHRCTQGDALGNEIHIQDLNKTQKNITEKKKDEREERQPKHNAHTSAINGNHNRSRNESDKQQEQ